MTNMLVGMMEGLGKLVAEEATKLLTKDNISEASRQFFANSNISVNILASVFGATILFGFFLLCEFCSPNNNYRVQVIAYMINILLLHIKILYCE